jgi:hypothetical protein
MRTGICHRGLRENGHASMSWISGVICILFVCGLCVFLSAPAIAQEPEKVEPPAAGSGQEVSPPPPQAADQSEQKTAPEQPETQPKEKGKKKHSKLQGLVVAPLPISSPAIGSGIIPVLGYIFPFNSKDKVSPPSTVGVAGLITDNGVLTQQDAIAGLEFSFSGNARPDSQEALGLSSTTASCRLNEFINSSQRSQG